MTHPTLAPEPDTDADAAFRNWMRLNLAQAAEKFGLSVTGAPVFGWRLRSIGAVAHGPNGACWLRVVSEQPQWATGEFWTGNQDANTLTELPKPVVLASTEWDEAGCWNNLLQPQLGILDWEMWGKGPVGTDAATLYCCILLNPHMARRVHNEFSDILDSPDGAIAQLWVAARLLKRIKNSGDFPDLETPLRKHSLASSHKLGR